MVKWNLNNCSVVIVNDSVYITLFTVNSFYSQVMSIFFLTAKGQQGNEEKSKDDSAVKKIDSIEQPLSTGETLSVINADMKVDEP